MTEFIMLTKRGIRSDPFVDYMRALLLRLNLCDAFILFCQ